MNHGELKRTALCEIHRHLGARMVEFAGWEMPVQYAGPMQEHMAVRTRAGIFDVSHMGEIEVAGSNALETIQRVTSNDAKRLAIGQVHYSALTTPAGTFVDDILVYRMGPDRFFLCVNCSNQEKDYRWILESALPGTEVKFRSDEFSQLAVQGPTRAGDTPAADGHRSEVHEVLLVRGGKVRGRRGHRFAHRLYRARTVSRSILPRRTRRQVWTRIWETGRPLGLEPAGLAARNTLRLEAKMALYGNDIDETTTVLEADLAWICRLDKGDFIGREPCCSNARKGSGESWSDSKWSSAASRATIIRIRKDGEDLGVVTSGSPAPFLQKNIGLAYLPTRLCAAGTEFDVIIRGKPVKARVVPTPFYKRAKSSLADHGPARMWPGVHTHPVSGGRCNVSRGESLHERSRMGERSGRPGNRGHHGVRPARTG